MEHKNGLEDCYVMKNNKKLHCGYTTGSCAAAAAKAAVRMLLLQKKISEVELMTPKGILLHLLTEDVHLEKKSASCAIRKDGGDDPDATHGLLIYAHVTRSSQPGVQIDGGKGVGRVTQKGLWQSVGEAAINRVPREMIREAVQSVCEDLDYAGGISVVISVPGGEEVAKKTFNPRLGIKGGISILGTSGIVVPMSEAALIASIRLEMEMRHANGDEYLIITPGNYGEDFLREHVEIDLKNSMKCSNYVGETLDMAAEMGVKGILFIAHIGKFIKVSGGIMNTHSRHADSRAELMAAQAIRAGSGDGKTHIRYHYDGRSHRYLNRKESDRTGDEAGDRKDSLLSAASLRWGTSDRGYYFFQCPWVPRGDRWCRGDAEEIYDFKIAILMENTGGSYERKIIWNRNRTGRSGVINIKGSTSDS